MYIHHLSNTTCLTQVFCKSGESCSKVWQSLTRPKARKTSEAFFRQAALDKYTQFAIQDAD